ncbi:MAG: hypothetical protein QOD09_3684 [Bradyrhizobium sp.]|jgi:hypothetical protein|nr:hypothetical protein [Bradyrhizobium sp.]
MERSEIGDAVPRGDICPAFRSAHGGLQAATRRSRTCECIPIPVPKTSLILPVSCSMEGRFLEATLSADGARAGRTGAPRNGRRPGGWWSAGRRCALPWARAVSPCRARWAHHPPQGCPLVPWRLPPLHPLARFVRDFATSDALRRENTKAWLFESLNQKLRKRALNLAPLAGRGRRASSDARRVRGQALRPPNEKLSGRKVCDATSTTREYVDCINRTASPLTRSLRCASASTSPRKSGARLKSAASGVGGRIVVVAGLQRMLRRRNSRRTFGRRAGRLLRAPLFSHTAPCNHSFVG